jgi:hypothetical protein
LQDLVYTPLLHIRYRVFTTPQSKHEIRQDVRHLQDPVYLLVGREPELLSNIVDSLTRNQVPEWSTSYINYKGLKKEIKEAEMQKRAGDSPDLARA